MNHHSFNHSYNYFHTHLGIYLKKTMMKIRHFYKIKALKEIIYPDASMDCLFLI